jgi:hypothetical protein
MTVKPSKSLKPLCHPYRLCAGVLAVGMTMQEAASAQTSVTRSVPDNYSCYNTEAVAIDDWSTVDMAAFSQATKQVGAQTLRLPGGDAANYWNWEFTRSDGSQDGGVWEWYGAGPDFPLRPTLSTLSPADAAQAFPFFFLQPLPPSLQFQTETRATLANVKPLVTNTGADTIWVMNMLSSTLDKEMNHLKDAIALGMSVNRIELGNELYLPLPNYTINVADGSPLPEVGAMPTPESYAARAKTWAQAIKNDPILGKAANPNLQIAITGVADSNSSDARISGWMSALEAPSGPDNLSAIDVVDAFTIHPYYTAADLGVTKADVGNNARAGAIARDGIATLRGILADPGINTPALQNKKMWVTEHNILETDEVVLGNSWVGALMLDLHGQEFLKDVRTQVSCAHVLTGNPQWQAIANEQGTVVDPAKRGIEDQPFSDIAQPFSPTTNGLVLGESANVFTEGTATLLHSGAASIAWRVENDTADKISAINANDIAELLELPADKIWKVLTFSSDPWATATSKTDLITTIQLIKGGTTIALSPFSKIIATAEPTDMETVPEPAAGLGFGLVAAGLMLSRRRRGETASAQFSKTTDSKAA